MTLAESRVRGLRQQYPDWAVHQSDAGRWWARRVASLPVEALKAGCRMTLDADDLDSLDRLLREQALRTTEVSPL